MHYDSYILFGRKFHYVTHFCLLPRFHTGAEHGKPAQGNRSCRFCRHKSQRLIEEHISGSVAASERPGLTRLLDRMENGDVLIVSKLDRLGRNAMDVRKTVEQLAASGIRVHCLALGGVDLTSPAGKMTMQVISAVTVVEKDLLIERTHAGIARPRASG